MEYSCRRCVYSAELDLSACVKCREIVIEGFNPTLKSVKLHIHHFDCSSTGLAIAFNKVGPGYFVGDQTDFSKLEWVSTIKEASDVLVDMAKQQNWELRSC